MRRFFGLVGRAAFARKLAPVFAIALAATSVCELSSCVAYAPDALLLRQRKWAIARTVGCLDVATEIVRDSAVPESSRVVDVTFGNRCTRGVHVDFTKLHVVAFYPDGARTTLTPYDPHHEIEPKLLAPAGVGREMIEFDSKDDRPAPSRLCVELDALDGDHIAERTPPMCFANDVDGMLPIVEWQR